MKPSCTIFGLILLPALFLTSLPAPALSSPETVSTAPQARLRVYYFHGTSRCRTCLAIEKFTRQAVNSGFAGELEKGEMELRAINVDLKENRHFIEDYQLFTRSVVISLLRDGKQAAWKRLDRVWELVRDEAAFTAYVQEEIRALMGEKPR